MVDLKVNYLGLNQTFRMPTSMSEVNMNVIADYVSHVNVSKDYALIAVVFKERPITIVSVSKQNKNASVSGVAVMIKSNTDDEFVKGINLGEAIVISPSDISMGHHVNSPNNPLTPGFLLNLLQTNSDLNKKLMAIGVPTYFVDFKIVPVCNIHGSIGKYNPTSMYYITPDAGETVTGK
nr:MAG TPA: hypothetical protein [Crassvirales sp.]